MGDICHGPQPRRACRSSGQPSACKPGCLSAKLLEKVVPLVINEYERREIDDLDSIDRLHTQLRILQEFDLLDVVLGKDRRGAPDGSKVETSVLLAGIGNLLADWAEAQQARQGNNTTIYGGVQQYGMEQGTDPLDELWAQGLAG